MGFPLSAFLLSTFLQLPRWLLLATIVYAPWAYGCTRWWAKTLLVQSLLAVTFLWICSLLLRRRWPRVTPAAGIAAFLLLGIGWFSVFNALATYDELLQVFSPIAQPLPGWLGSWDAAFSTRGMLLVTALMGGFFISMDLAANPLWRKRLFLTLALSGGLLLLFGLVQRATAAQGIYWERAPGSTFFATYFNHSNAGAFINLTLPIVAGQAILAFQGEASQLKRALWSFLLLVNITAVFVNTSRASMAIGLFILMALTTAGASVLIGKRRKMTLRPQLFATVVVVFACAAILLLSFGVDRSVARWNQTLSAVFASEGGAVWEGRVTIYRVCWLSLHAAGWFGFGPGTFAIVFPHLHAEHGGQIDGILRYAHQDYLQTILEWGRLGFLVWVVLIGGGIARAILPLWRDPRLITREQGMWTALCTLSLLGILIHSLVDFPLQIASLQLISAVLLGQLWSKAHDKRRPPAPHAWRANSEINDP
jgi:O-antigen ligase